MLVKLLDSTLTEVKINGTKYPVRWEIDDQGNAVLGMARVDGLGYDKSKNLYQVETQRNIDVFYKQFTLPAGSYNYVYFDEIQHASSALIDVSKYKSMDIIINSPISHDFQWTDSAGFRTIGEDFGAYFTLNLGEISDEFIKTSLEHDTKTNNDGTNKRYVYALNTKIVQSLFSIAISNKSSSEQTYHMEIRLRKV